MRYTVFCGSSAGSKVEYMASAKALGAALAKKQIGVVYGGAKVGLMGAIADGALSHGGEVIGVLPHFLADVELGHTGLTSLYHVDTMHERKAKMDELSDGIIALPGGYGTLEEFFEVLTWGQLGLHKKPIALYNVAGFYNPLMLMIDSMVEQGFLKKENKEMIIISDDIDALLQQMIQYEAPKVGKWIAKDQPV
ncbi:MULTISPECIES: TIGR00730 family Rossman fold protein [unclassified Myroides]|uniref:LOG family protein n=1 Tax=unclassified Myroides TaxID=2642485 RepID=UPI0015FAA431|nr:MULTISPECIES: TIGR00730 family Rossman fold protein [unclassified Myroides]MBB1150369.1 TIGR00730 family Rossman fold protein [Myroides sp. NP-2]MDM1407391.1 TIGR00730 family Rossman fold protein [Myroides sp. DF42-4-2]